MSKERLTKIADSILTSKVRYGLQLYFSPFCLASPEIIGVQLGNRQTDTLLAGDNNKEEVKTLREVTKQTKSSKKGK